MTSGSDPVAESAMRGCPTAVGRLRYESPGAERWVGSYVNRTAVEFPPLTSTPTRSSRAGW
jgi:hypothetical protein